MADRHADRLPVQEAHMGDVFHQQVTRWLLAGRRVKAHTPGAQKVTTRTKMYYGEYRDGDGGVRRAALSRNKAAARVMLAELVKKAELARVGVRDPFEAQRDRPLAEHVAEFVEELRAGSHRGRGRPPSAESLAGTRARLEKVISGAGFARAEDVTRAGVQELLSGLQAGTVRPLVPAQESFRPAEAAALLGIGVRSIHALAARHDLPRTGYGRAQRYPRETVLALAEAHCRGTGRTTPGRYAADVKRFTRWLVKRGRLARDPLDDLPGRYGGGDHRHDRRNLTLDEMRRLLGAARESDRKWRGLSGADRHALYLTACYTGFRAKELSRLTPSSFAVDGALLCVLLPGSATKNAKCAVQPVPDDVARLLLAYLIGKPVSKPVWPGTWRQTASLMVKRDLKAAGIPYTVPGPDGPLYADFHALRHSYVGLLDQAGVSLKNAMILARVSDPRLVLARYARPQLHDVGADVGRLPSLVTGVVTGANAGQCGPSPVIAGDGGVGRTGGSGGKSAG